MHHAPRHSALRAAALLACFALPLGAVAQEAAPATPAMPIMTPAQAQQHATDQAAKDTTPVYDEKADAAKDIAAAIARAKKNNKRVLIQWGANWCHWCVKLDKLARTDKDIRKAILYEYEVVHVDIGKFDKNLDLTTKFGADIKASGVPYLTVLDSEGKAIVNQETGALEKPKPDAEHDPAKVLAFLTQHQATPLDADTTLAAALRDAKDSGRKVFVHFSAPWCGWCHKLEAWMEQEGVKAALAKDFIDLKIDIDRDTHGKQIHDRLNPKPGGIPWMAVLGADGVKVSDSNASDGNIGFPAAEAEIKHFMGMLRTSASHMNEDDFKAIETSLKPKAEPR